VGGFNAPACTKYYSQYYPAGSWNGKFTKNNNKPITNVVTSGVNFPIAYEIEYNGKKIPISIQAADVDRFYDKTIFKIGYTKVAGSTASMAMNCHGFSTGLSYWTEGFIDVIKQNDYTTSTKPSELAVGVIKGTEIHTIKITEVNKTIVKGENIYKVIKTREKYRSSAVYEKSIHDEIYTDNETVGYPFYIAK
jgi:hypothetical protein